jgi:DHA2 family multidrug resistance protein
MLAIIIQVLDATVANVALPHMQASLSATSVVSVLTSYVMVTALVMPAVGWLTGKWCQRQLLLASVGGFAVASAVCGFAQTMPQMILARTLQGALSASLVPVSLSIMLDSLPDEKRAPTIAIWGAGLTIGPLAGPIVGGWLTGNLNWRWVFLLNMLDAAINRRAMLITYRDDFYL